VKKVISIYCSKKGTHRAGSKNTFWTRYNGNTITYVNPGNFYNQRYSDEPESIVDKVDEEEDDNACYYRSRAIETETEDKEVEEQGNRRSCHYKAKRSYY